MTPQPDAAPSLTDWEDSVDLTEIALRDLERRHYQYGDECADCEEPWPCAAFHVGAALRAARAERDELRRVIQGMSEDLSLLNAENHRLLDAAKGAGMEES